jgi:HEAT repeat protein
MMEANMSTSSIEELIEALDSSDIMLRENARRKLLEYGNQAITPLIVTLKSQTGRKSWEAARVLAAFDDPACREVMLEMVTSPNLLIGSIAVNSLESSISLELISKLIESLPSCSGGVQLQIVGLIERYGDQHAIEPLVKLLESNPWPSLASSIIRALGTLGDGQIVDLIRQFSNHPDHHVRESVRVALQQLGGATDSDLADANRESEV